MAGLRPKQKPFNQSSRDPHLALSLRFRDGEAEFTAQGPSTVVSDKFHEVVQLLHRTWLPQNPPSQTLSDTTLRGFKDENAQPERSSHLLLRRLLHHDPTSEVLMCPAIPTGRHPEAQMILLLLLGYQYLHNTSDVSVMTLKRSLQCSHYPVARLDRLLAPYRREHLILKTGRGKGGRYRLTTLGLQKAIALAQNLSHSESPNIIVAEEKLSL